VTTTEFMEELERVRDQFDWSLRPDTGWAPDRRSRPRLHIRATGKRGPVEGRVFEPIGAVCYGLNGQIYDEKSWKEAAAALDLLPISAAELRAAANDQTWAGAEGAREPVEHLQALRDRLIAAAGLETTKLEAFRRSS
jgi:hypothetical protein